MASVRATRFQTERSYKHEARVYVLVEEARLRCEALQATADAGERRSELHRLHRDLGLSALHVSTYIPSAVRCALLARVHGRCDHLGRGTKHGLERTVRRARRLLARARAKDRGAAHLELAELHLLRAMEFLTPWPARRPAVGHILRPRHLA